MTDEIRVGLGPTRQRSGLLFVTHEPGDVLPWRVSLFEVRRAVPARQNVYASAHRDERAPRLRCAEDGWVLWLGRAAFALTAHEAKQLRTAFWQYGLTVDSEEVAAAPPTSLGSGPPEPDPLPPSATSSPGGAIYGVSGASGFVRAGEAAGQSSTPPLDCSAVGSLSPSGVTP